MNFTFSIFTIHSFFFSCNFRVLISMCVCAPGSNLQWATTCLLIISNSSYGAMLSSEKIFLNYSERMRILLYYTAAVACKFFQSSVLIKILFLFYFFIYLLYNNICIALGSWSQDASWVTLIRVAYFPELAYTVQSRCSQTCLR